MKQRHSQKTRTEEQTCPGCGMAKNEWEGHGRGYESGGQTYCCEGCAEGTGCSCA